MGAKRGLVLNGKKMSLGAAVDYSAPEIYIPSDIEWHVLSKSKFFFLGAALLCGMSDDFYIPILVRKLLLSNCGLNS